MSKKILSVVLALVLIMSTFVTVAFAVSYENKEDASINKQVWSLSEPTKVNDTTYTVDVNLKTNYATGEIQFAIVEDDADNAIELTNVTIGSAVPATYNAELSKNLGKGIVYIVPQTVEETEIVKATAIDGVIATLTYTYTGTGSGTIAISNDPKTDTNKGGTLIAARMGNENVVSEDMIVGQSVVDANGAAITDKTITPVTIGATAAAEPELVLTETGATNGVVIDTNKTFGGTYAGAVYGFPQLANNTFSENTGAYLSTNLAVENGTWTLGKSIGKSGWGTGTTITLNDADGNATDKVYVVVIFADVDGNGAINVRDTTAVKNAVADATIYAENSVQRMAANAYNTTGAAQLHTLNVRDTTAVKNHVSGSGKIDYALLAQRMNANTTYYK